MEELINNVVKLPMATKLGILAGLIVAVSAGNYFLWPGVADTVERTEREKRTLKTLEDELVKKEAIANNLSKYRRELEVLEQRLKDALTEMPEEVKMDDLLAQFAELAKKAGLTLTNITPQAESKEGGFYYRIPIKMEVSGGYHEVAVFLDSLSKLKRIVNVNNLTLASPTSESEKIVLKADYLATTFRFAGGTEPADDGKKRRAR